jgi:hypothetical protein
MQSLKVGAPCHQVPLRHRRRLAPPQISGTAADGRVHLGPVQHAQRRWHCTPAAAAARGRSAIAIAIAQQVGEPGPGNQQWVGSARTSHLPHLPHS